MRPKIAMFLLIGMCVFASRTALAQQEANGREASPQPTAGSRVAQAHTQARPNPELKTREGVPLSQAEQERGEEARAERSPKSSWALAAGTKMQVMLRQAISTKNAQQGDMIYGQTSFPVFVDQQVVIPGGTFVQGVVDSVKRAGRLKGTAELRFHLTKLLYPNGYVVDMTAPIEQVPGDENSKVKEPGTVKHDSEKGKDLERVGRDASEAGSIGTIAGLGVSPTLGGVRAGGLTGLAAGTMIGLLARGSDVRFETGTVVDVVLNKPITLDLEKIMRTVAIPAYYPTPMPYPTVQIGPPR